jgi:hypothetical protein
MPQAPQSRPGQYAELDTAELADAVERSYERDELPDWELVFELTRRAMSPEASAGSHEAMGASGRPRPTAPVAQLDAPNAG